MSTTAKNEKPLSGDSPICGKTRGNRLARRARSFKEDFLEIISQMRSPGGSATRSGSPCSPKTRTKTTDFVDGAVEKNPSKDLECNIRQAQLALKHFRGVVNKNKLEMLPGNGTVVLETVTAIHVLLKKYVLNEQRWVEVDERLRESSTLIVFWVADLLPESVHLKTFSESMNQIKRDAFAEEKLNSTLVSATNQVYQSVAKLIKLCDDYLLVGEKALGKENVAEIVNLVEDAIQNLVSLTKDKLILRDPAHKLGGEPSTNHVKLKPRALPEKNNLDLGQRSSLPDIPLTPREREILERTSAFVLERHSQSSENVLGDSPPPKPPHPDRVFLDPSFPPPLPPKKRQKHPDEVAVIKSSMECLSLRSKSPEDSSSLLSASAGSLDSVLNHCSREEELTSVLLNHSENDHCTIRNSAFDSNSLENGCSHDFHWEYSSSSTEHGNSFNASALLGTVRDSPLPLSDAVLTEQLPGKVDRFSGSQTESGFSSMPSRRSSSQSYSASSQQLSSSRSSQQSYTSQESHFHTEKKMTSTMESTNCQKFQSVTSESIHSQTSSQRIVSSSTSSEKLSYQKQTAFRRATETTTGGEMFCAANESPSKKLEDIPCCHHEIKIQECPFHASFLSSTPESVRAVRQTSSDHINRDNDKRPALPEKLRKRERHPSQYDNFDEVMCSGGARYEKNSSVSHTVVQDGVVSHKQSSFSAANAVNVSTVDGVTNISQTDRVDGTVLESKTTGNITEQSLHSVSHSMFQSTNSQTLDGNPPPLPPKKKHMFQSVAYSVMAYMEIFGNASHANANEFLRHSVHAYNLLQSEWQQHQKLLTSAQSCSLTFSCDSNQTTPVRTIESKSGTRTSLPPALPPKKRTRSTNSSPPPTPTLILVDYGSKKEESTENHKDTLLPSTDLPHASDSLSPTPTSAKDLTPVENSSSDTEKEGEISLLDKLNVSEYLVMKKAEDEGPDIRGGHPDALVIHATKAHKNDFLYQEAFLTTYRTFMTPLELIQKLCYRHEKFSSSQDTMKQRAARESFSLLVRVVSDLTLTDLDQVVLQTLMEFVQQLLCRGDLTMAKALRVIMLSKYEAKKLYLSTSTLLPSHSIYTRQSLLLDFKSEQIAEQMTLLDAELFLKIEIPEVLIWAQEQNEERSPNLTKFTEHFNKMSYWARSRILEQNDAKDREKYVLKFIKIMKHLRKINNFNSYLALLSALDSAPIRRLEWQKHITEGLKEYCALIDSSSSFRAYRQALAETHPPCIPYIGLVLQDLTFVHIGNTNNLPSGDINFSKRWQQFNIVENMKRFKKGSYPYKKNDRIIAFFNGFDDSLSEEAMWQISEKIKPRGGKKT